jgi:hypothetical protein
MEQDLTKYIVDKLSYLNGTLHYFLVEENQETLIR